MSEFGPTRATRFERFSTLVSSTKILAQSMNRRRKEQKVEERSIHGKALTIERIASDLDGIKEQLRERTQIMDRSLEQLAALMKAYSNSRSGLFLADHGLNQRDKQIPGTVD